MRRRAAAQRGWVVAAVALLHAGLIEMLLSDRVRGTADAPEQSAALRWTVVVPPGPGVRSAADLSRRMAVTVESLPALPVGSAPKLPGFAPPDGPDTEHRAGVDWEAELERGARAATADAGAPPRDFGFPHVPANAAPERPEFGWYHARTHRIESLPGGGILVNLNDRCVMLIAPLPFAFCRWGTLPVDGTLFDHMRDAPSPAAVTEPP